MEIDNTQIAHDDEQHEVGELSLMHKYFQKLKLYLATMKRQRQIQIKIMGMENNRQERMYRECFDILRDYSRYRHGKKLRNMQVYYYEQKSLKLRTIKGIYLYSLSIKRFQQNLQKFYCRYLFKKYFELLKVSKNKGTKQLSIRVEMLTKKSQRNNLKEYFGCWREQTEFQVRRKTYMRECLERTQRIILTENKREALVLIKQYSQTMKQTMRREVKQPEERKNSLEEDKQSIFSYKRKYRPIRDISKKPKGDRTDRTPQKQHTPQRISRQPSMTSYPQSPKQSTVPIIQKNPVRILRNLIDMKQVQLNTLKQPIFLEDKIYEQMRTKLKLQLDHYIELLRQCKSSYY